MPTPITQTIEALFKRNSKAQKRRAELTAIITELDRTTHEKDLADLAIFTPEAQKEILDKVAAKLREEAGLV